MTEPIRRSINGFNSRCIHVITGDTYANTARNPPFDLVLVIRRRLRFLGHVLRMKKNRLVRRTFEAYVDGGGYRAPAGSLLEDVPGKSLHALTNVAKNKGRWKKMVNKLK